MSKIYKLISVSFILFSFFTFMSPIFAQTVNFSDVKEGEPYFTEIQYLAEKSVIHGYPDGKFLPSGKINRAELMKLMVKMQGVDPDAKVYKNCFTDVQDQWFAPYVCYAKEKQWIEGYEDGTFKPANSPQYSEVLKIVLNPLFADQISAQTKEDIAAGIKGVYGVETEDWFAPFVSFATRSGVIGSIYSGKGDSFYYSLDLGKGDDFSYYTPGRGKVAEMIFRVLLMKENNLKIYNAYYADNILKKEGFSDLVFSQSGCYDLDSLEFDFYSDYLKAKYGVEKPYGKLYLLYYDYTGSTDEKSSTFPLFDSGSFCSLENEEILFSSTIAFAKDDVQQHLMRFNKEGKLMQDQGVKCEQPSFFGGELLGLNAFDLSTLKLIDCTYVQDKNHVYALGEEMEGVDVNSFEPLQFPYSKDKNHVYFGADLLKEADPSTFELLLQYPDSGNSLDELLMGQIFLSYSKDATHVFYMGELVVGADPKTFTVLELAEEKIGKGTPYSYAKDANHVFYSGKLLPDSDSKTFTLLGKGYAKDSQHVYYYNNLIEGADVATFQLYKLPDSSYSGSAFDKNAIYSRGQFIEEFDPATMQMINEFFIKKEGLVYYFNGYELKNLRSEAETLDAEDFKNFTLLENVPIYPGMWAKNDNKIYLMYVHLIEILDAPTFEFINKVYSKDKNNVFHLEVKGPKSWCLFDIKGADPATFEPLASEDTLYKDFGKDATHVYHKTETLDIGPLDLATADLLEDKGVIKDAKGYTCKIDPVNLGVLSCS